MTEETYLERTNLLFDRAVADSMSWAARMKAAFASDMTMPSGY